MTIRKGSKKDWNKVNALLKKLPKNIKFHICYMRDMYDKPMKNISLDKHQLSARGRMAGYVAALYHCGQIAEAEKKLLYDYMKGEINNV